MSYRSDSVKCVLAVSGGVDSIVLLDAIVNNRLSELTNYTLPAPKFQLIVAHVDHGIRPDSAADELFTRGVAQHYDIEYVAEQLNLGPTASEDTARTMRYKFLRQCCKKYNATLITAHHQDDLVETMLINLIRGTGWRGLAPMSQTLQTESQISDSGKPATGHQKQASFQNDGSSDQILRPLLTVPKAIIIEYANQYHLKWQEDSTNTDERYLRNYIRHTLLPVMQDKDSNAISKLLTINQNVTKLKNEIATELQKITPNQQLAKSRYDLARHQLIMWPPSVAREVIYYKLTQLDPQWHPNSLQISRALHFIKTAGNHKTMDVSGRLSIQIEDGSVQFKKA